MADQKHPHHAYGALARDGISCTACQGMVEEYKDLGDFLANSITGQYKAGPATEIYGPFCRRRDEADAGDARRGPPPRMAE